MVDMWIAIGISLLSVFISFHFGHYVGKLRQNIAITRFLTNIVAHGEWDAPAAIERIKTIVTINRKALDIDSLE